MSMTQTPAPQQTLAQRQHNNSETMKHIEETHDFLNSTYVPKNYQFVLFRVIKAFFFNVLSQIYNFPFLATVANSVSFSSLTPLARAVKKDKFIKLYYETTYNDEKLKFCMILRSDTTICYRYFPDGRKLKLFTDPIEANVRNFYVMVKAVFCYDKTIKIRDPHDY